MAKFIRYALATFCFAAGVGCLALWGWCVEQGDRGHELEVHLPPAKLRLYCDNFEAGTIVESHSMQTLQVNLKSFNVPMRDARTYYKYRAFRVYNDSIFFPFWYPALIFALAGVGVLRVSRQFSIRSALVATTVMAALIGMAVIL